MKKERQKPDVFMPIFIGDYLGDTMELDAEAHGAYLLLLMTAWRRGGRLPTDQAQLTGMARVKPKRWPQVWGLIARFFDVDGDSLVQRRLMSELNKAVGRIEAASENGKNGAQKRWAGHDDGNGKTIATPSINDSHPIVSPVAEVVAKNASSPSPSQKNQDGIAPLTAGGQNRIDPLTCHGLITLLRAAVEREQPHVGMWNPGQWANKAARDFIEAIPAERRNDRLRDEIRRRIGAFASCRDERVTKGKWLVEAFCESYNTLTAEQPRRDPVLEASVAKSGGRPYLPPEKAVASGS